MFYCFNKKHETPINPKTRRLSQIYSNNLFMNNFTRKPFVSRSTSIRFVVTFIMLVYLFPNKLILDIKIICMRSTFII